MRLDKYISEGGSLRLCELTDKFEMRARAARKIVEGLYPNINPVTMSGHIDKYPRYIYTTKKKL